MRHSRHYLRKGRSKSQRVSFLDIPLPLMALIRLKLREKEKLMKG
jgi:hypothetical protein